MYLLVVEERLIGQSVANLVVARHIGAGVDGFDAGHLQGLGCVDVLYQGVGHGASVDFEEGRALRYVVGRVPGLTKRLVKRVRPDDVLADDEEVLPA